MADLMNVNHIKDRHNDLKIRHNDLRVLEFKNQNKAYALQIEKIMEVDISDINFKIECNKKLIDEINQFNESIKNKKNKEGEIING